ncbi:hypothetical protein DOTSEDRAFT_160857 [Lecanosticta acicola]|uniref:G-patch domain-containing protein n=1 Tax=Lecanosticta acicola TaxID=111012 RepID=A0AAI8W1Y1_9PEZI|nr:hypothetical protein DOTSEDRAFT_160857 [Lecanosticta acicola]
MDGWRPRHSRDNDSSDATGEFRIRGISTRRSNDLDAPPRGEHHYHRERTSRYDSGRDRTVVYEEPQGPPANTGEDDAALAGTKSKFLLVRGLKVNTDETLLSNGLKKFYLDEPECGGGSQPKPDPSVQPTPKPMPLAKPMPPGCVANPSGPSGARPGSLKRVFIIRDRDTNKSMKYGFAEYHSSTDASAAQAKCIELGDKSTISSSKITLEPADPGIFAPVIGRLKRDSQFFFEHGGNLFQYRDQRYWASPMLINEEPPVEEKPSADNPAGELAQPSKKRAMTAGVDPSDSGRTKKPKTGNLQIAEKWQKKQAELRGDDGGEDDQKNTSDALSDSHPAQADGQSSAVQPIAQSFIWQREVKGQTKNSCLLCLTDLPTHIEPQRHVKESAKHAANMKDEVKYKQGLENLKKRGVVEESTLKVFPDVEKRSPSHERPTQQREFQDRAAMRREMEAKADTASSLATKISIPLGNDHQAKKKQTPEIAKDASSGTAYGKGMAMLKKSGWKAGEPLGSGDGIVQPIETNMYQAGVGLGHESSKIGDAVAEARRFTQAGNGGGGFIEKTKEVFKDRFEKMS